METYVIFGFFVASLFAAAFSCIYHYRREARMSQQELKKYQETYLRRYGWWFTSDYYIGYYHIRSFDGGKMWYAAEETNCGLKILGRAEKVYPFLMKSPDCPREADSGGQPESQKDVLKTTDRARQNVTAIEKP